VYAIHYTILAMQCRVKANVSRSQSPFALDSHACTPAAARVVAHTGSIKGPHKATHRQGEATSQHRHRGQQTLRREVTQAWGAVPPTPGSRLGFGFTLNTRMHTCPRPRRRRSHTTTARAMYINIGLTLNTHAHMPPSTPPPPAPYINIYTDL